MATCVTLQGVLRGRAKSHHPGRLLLYPLGNTCNPVEITYTDLYQQAKHNSYKIRALEEFNIGRPVLLHFDDHWDTILWFWSVLFAGGLPVLSTPFSNVEHERRKHIEALSALLHSPICITRSRLVHLFGKNQDIHFHPVENLLGESQAESGPHEELRHNIQGCDCDMCTRNRAQDHEDGGIPTCDGTQNGDLGIRGSNCNEDDYNTKGGPVMLMLTSGSTGNAKAVQFTHRQVLAALAGKAAVRPLPPDRPFLNWIGIDHVAGLIEIHLLALWLGVDQVHVSAADVVPSPRTFLHMLSRHRISRTFAPNFFLAKLVSAVDGVVTAENEWDLSSLVGVVSGGEANDMKTCVAASALFEKYGAPANVIIIGFGMTETCAGSIYNGNCPDYDVAQGHAVASVGKCISGIEMRITTPGNPTGVAAPGESGDLEVRGLVICEGYYHNQIATNEAFTPDHWFRTGDQGMIDSDGNLNLVGRSKEVININGLKVAIVDIQQAIEQALGDRVARLVVFPSKNAYTERVTIMVIPNTFPMRDEEMMNITRLATQACLLSTATLPFVFPLSEYSLPRLPTSTLGKISRSKLERLFEHGEFARDVELYEQAIRRAAEQMRKCDHSGGRGLTTETETRLIEDIAGALDTTPDVLGIHAGTSIFDIGFTSMHVIKLKYRIDKRLGIDFPVIHIMKNPPVRSLAADIDAQLRQPRPLASEKDPVVSYDPVVVFREEGTKTPLWLIHPGVGEVLVFIRLAQHLSVDNRPVFALRAAGFESGQRIFGSITEAVDVYTTAIRRCQPRGPYALAGYSYGTLLAFEVAKRLEGAGEEVGFLGSFNLPPHIKFRIRQLNWNTCLLHLAHFLELVSEDVSEDLAADSAFCAAPRADVIERVLGIADKSRLDELKMETGALVHWVDVVFGLQRIAVDYDPSGEVGRIDVFHAVPLRAVASSQEEWLRDHLSRWADFVREQPRFHAVQGAHYTMIGPEHVKTFAATLMKALKARGL
ncbi:acetyl-CoA synthetase-like protein [Annulohypoxylon bovei var. microspora]|nr:acetyl-CoA synthetase-like protein [Annulohypoxylon bovei var. microspora]